MPNIVAHIDNRVFLGAHRHAVGIREHFAGDFLDGLVFVALFAGLDEVGVFSETGGVEDDRHAVLVADFADFLQVLHRNRLAAGGVVGHRHDNERHVSLVFGQSFVQFGRIHIPFERYFQLGVGSFIDRAVQSDGPAVFDMAFCRVEMGIARDHIAFFHGSREEHVFGSAALVGRQHVLESGDFFNHVLHIEERTGTGIAFVSQHDGSPLFVAHRSGPGVGQEIYVHLVRWQFEQVVLGFLDPLFTFFTGAAVDVFYHLDAVGFCEW